MTAEERKRANKARYEEMQRKKRQEANAIRPPTASSSVEGRFSKQNRLPATVFEGSARRYPIPPSHKALGYK